MAHNPLITPIARVLHAHPEGLSEYALLKALEFDGLKLDQEPDATDELVLFRKHFLIMNALYRLQPIMYDEGFELQISALHIQLHPLPENLRHSDATALTRGDQPLRDYYLDWSEFENSSSDYVRKLLSGFWERYLSDDQRQDAWQVLDLEPGADEQTIRAAYRRLAARHHPDKGGDAEQFCRVREAYELLMV
ncbi:DNA-J related domain-containing protein [Marinobacterium litorale]|uniref:DNA-J related domain-containing protein n=1 Tax=Marinobacterium litorale TaxID=404770 RepID=UPI000411CDF8|nr:DNA-J related domain-containing protein [Marinobacterium litorale]